MPALRLAFSSPGALGGPAEALRLRRWWEEYRANYGGTEVFADPELPFATSMEFLPLGGMRLARWRGSVTRVERRREHAAHDGEDRFILSINRSPTDFHAETGSRSAAIPRGAAFLGDFSRPGFHACRDQHDLVALHIPRQLVMRSVSRAEDKFGAVVPAANDALRLLTSYAEALFATEGLSHSAVLEQGGQTLMDLVALAFGTDRDNEEIAKSRGAARGAARCGAAADSSRIFRSRNFSPTASLHGWGFRPAICTSCCTRAGRASPSACRSFGSKRRSRY